MRRLLVTLVTLTLLPLLSANNAVANGAPTFTVNSQTVTGVTITDTTEWDAFTDVVGTTNVVATLLGGVDAVDPPNTQSLTYTKMKVGDYGTMFLGGTDFAYVVDSDAINGLGADANVSDAFSFDTDGNESTTGDTAVFTISLVGRDDIPTIGTAVPDFTEGVEAADVSTSSASSRVPSSEQPIKAFDDSTATKYLNLDKAGSDLIVDVGTQYVLTALGLTTANDSPERNPTKVRIYGSNSGSSDFVEIGSEITFDAPLTFYTDYDDAAVSNDTAYSIYKIVFTEIVGTYNGTPANSVQIAEVRLAGYAAADFPEYTPGDPATAFASAVTIYDENTTSASAEITANATDGDVLACGACEANSISATWASPKLSLAPSGSPTQANWQAAMRSLTFVRANAVGTANPTITLTVSDGGSTPGTAEIDIFISEVAPSIEPAAASVVIPAGVAITPITPSNAGDDATWTISPALPSGLSLNSSTGVISGTAAAAAAATEYTLTATNSVGSDTATFSLTIADLPTAPSSLSATAGNGSAAIAFTAGANGGSAITNYEYTLDDGTTWTALDPADTESPITIGGLTNGTTYTIAIRAISAAGNGAASDDVTVTPVTTPAAPTALSLETGDGSATISFTAGANGGSAITNYEYTLDDGTTWTALDPADTESPITIGGLTNGTTYTIAIRAISAAGNGAASDDVTVTPPLLPARDSDGELPQVTDGTKGIVVTDGVRTEIDVVVVDDRELVLAGDGYEMRLSGSAADGESTGIGDDGRLKVDSGGSLSVSGSGFAPGSTVNVWVMSDPQYLGQVEVGSDGSYSATLPLPADLPFGDHTVQANGVTSAGEDRSLNLGISLVVTGELPATGSNSAAAFAALLLAGGLMALVATRRRSTEPA